MIFKSSKVNTQIKIRDDDKYQIIFSINKWIENVDEIYNQWLVIYNKLKNVFNNQQINININDYDYSLDFYVVYKINLCERIIKQEIYKDNELRQIISPINQFNTVEDIVYYLLSNSYNIIKEKIFDI